MKSIKIDRSMWIRGNDLVPVRTANGSEVYQQGSMLLRPVDGKMCCVGQVCVQLGMNPRDIKHMATVDELLSVGVDAPEELLTTDPDSDEPEARLERDSVAVAYEINDDPKTTDAEKEAALIPLFKGMGLDVEFIN